MDSSFAITREAQGTFTTTIYPLKHSAILDSGTTLHIFNMITRFLNFRRALEGDYIYAGDAQVPILGYGEVDIKVQSPYGAHIMRLYDVAYCENFACNLVSLRLLRRKGYWWDNKSPNNCLRRKDDSVVCILTDRFNQFIIEDIPVPMTRASFGARRHAYNSWTEQPPRSGSADLWHLRLGHPGPEVLNHLSEHSRGVRVKGPTTTECDACGCAKARRKIRQQLRPGLSKAG